MRIYLAGPWFSEEQNELYDRVLSALKENKENELFVPREDVIEKDASLERRQEMFRKNVSEILDCDKVLAICQYPDVGTAFEIGYAFANNKQIDLYFENDRPFNVMLAACSKNIIKSIDDLKSNTYSVITSEVY